MTESTAPLRGLRAEIYVGPHGDCSNGGISSKAQYVTLVGPEFGEVFPVTEEAPAVKMVKRNIAGKVVVHFEPVEPCPPGHVGYMAGGAFVHGDSRFSEAVGFYGAASLHDRTESQSLYDALST